MGRAPCCDKVNVKKGPWSPEEDAKLKEFIDKHGTGGNWIALPHKAGLKRCGKSCRLRWLNYLRPNIKHGEFTEDEDKIICSLYASIGSRWSIIAGQLPGRTDNDIKNYWNTKLRKKLLAMLPSNFQKKTFFSPYVPLQSPPPLPNDSTFLNASSLFYNNYNKPMISFMNSASATTIPNLAYMQDTGSYSFLNNVNSTLTTTTTNANDLFSTPQPPAPPPSSSSLVDMISNNNYYLGFQDQNMNKDYYSSCPEVKEKMLMFGNGGGEISTTTCSSEISYIINNNTYHHHGIKQEDQFANLQNFGDGFMTAHDLHHPSDYNFKNLEEMKQPMIVDDIKNNSGSSSSSNIVNINRFIT